MGHGAEQRNSIGDEAQCSCISVIFTLFSAYFHLEASGQELTSKGIYATNNEPMGIIVRRGIAAQQDFIEQEDGYFLHETTALS